jgi:galactokinase
MDARDRAVRQFEERFGATPSRLVRAPARVNVIGEHTDYNGGWVLPAAIDRELWIALTPSGDARVEAASEAFGDPVELLLDEVGEAEPLEGWGVYLQGVARALVRDGRTVTGWRGTLASDIPVGAGLSSSAAMEMACARAFVALSEEQWDPMAMAHIGQHVENEWVGVRSGIMDQVASACGREGHALLLDCATLDVTPVPLPNDVALVVLDTGTRRALLGSSYGDRRQECETAAERLEVPSLRELDAAALEARAAGLDPVLHRRARHVVTENARTREAAEALRAGDAARLGALIDASHTSLRDDFEVSSAAFDAIVEAARAIDGCYGARLTGGGFAGCAIAVVATSHVEDFAAALPPAYSAATGEQATVHICRAVDGASVATGGAAQTA